MLFENNKVLQVAHRTPARYSRIYPALLCFVAAFLKSLENEFSFEVLLFVPNKISVTLHTVTTYEPQIFLYL